MVWVSLMYNVIIFGTGSTASIVKKLLDVNAKLIAYVDNDQCKWNKKIENVNVVGPNCIEKFKYDYIIIASQYNEEIYAQLAKLKVRKTKILQFYKFVDSGWNYYKYNIHQVERIIDCLQIINTGISYSHKGIREECFIKKAYNFAYGSQDLFYDYHTVKYLLTHYNKKINQLKYVIIGLSYYSFQFDMSLSAMKAKVILYHEVLNECHHFNNIQQIYQEYDINKRIANNIFRKNLDGSYDFKWDSPSFLDVKDKETEGKKQAEIDCNKNYPETVKEYTQIFRDYLRLLKDNNIKPIVVVFPATKYYTKYFSKRIEDEFHSIINETKQEYNFQYIDYFRSDLFEDKDFQDVSHLNPQGAEKFTKILNEIIEW